MAWCLTAPSHYLNQCWLSSEGSCDIYLKVIRPLPNSNKTENVHESDHCDLFAKSRTYNQRHISHPPGTNELMLESALSLLLVGFVWFHWFQSSVVSILTYYYSGFCVLRPGSLNKTHKCHHLPDMVFTKIMFILSWQTTEFSGRFRQVSLYYHYYH